MAYTWAQFKNAVKTLLTDKPLTDESAYIAVADYVRAHASRDLLGDIPAYTSFWGSWLDRRRDMLGYAITASDSTLKAEVRKLLTDFTPGTDDAGVRAVADFVKSRIASEVDKDQEMYALYNTRWLQQKGRLLGYTITLSDANLRTAINKLITVDANRIGIYEAGGFVETVMLQAKADLAALATFVDTNILRAKADLASSGTRLDAVIKQGVIEVQELIPFYQQGHETIFQPDDVTDDGEASLGAVPEEAQIREAYYVRTGDQNVRKPVTNWHWNNRFDLIAGAPQFKRDGAFYMAISPDGKQFMLFPPLLEGNYLAVYWNGLKFDFADGDTVPFDEGMAKAIADYTQKERYAEPGIASASLAKMHNTNYVIKRTALYRAALGKTKIASSPESPAQGSCCAVDAGDDQVVEFVAFGDSGESPLANTIAVATLAHELGPDFIIHLGDANYPAGDQLTFQANLLDHYSDFINAEKWYQALGNHDLAGIADGQYGKPLLDVLDYLGDMNSGKLYYSFSKPLGSNPNDSTDTAGSIEFFVINSGYTDGEPREPDGISYTSAQGLWMQAAIAASGATWKIAVFHRPGSSSDVNNTPGSAIMAAWPLKSWGIDLVLAGHGHSYERFNVDGLPMLVAGLGGATKRAFGATAYGSQFQYNSAYGLVRVAVTKTKLQASFVNTSGDVIDRLTLLKDA